jgi:hypothetical protein
VPISSMAKVETFPARLARERRRRFLVRDYWWALILAVMLVSIGSLSGALLLPNMHIPLWFRDQHERLDHYEKLAESGSRCRPWLGLASAMSGGSAPTRPMSTNASMNRYLHRGRSRSAGHGKHFGEDRQLCRDRNTDKGGNR